MSMLEQTSHTNSGTSLRKGGTEREREGPVLVSMINWRWAGFVLFFGSAIMLDWIWVAIEIMLRESAWRSAVVSGLWDLMISWEILKFFSSNSRLYKQTEREREREWWDNTFHLLQPTNNRICTNPRTRNPYVHTLFTVCHVYFVFLCFLPESSLAWTVCDKHEFHHYIKKTLTQ